MLAVSSQTFEDSCRMAKRNSLESATLSLNLFLGFMLQVFFFFLLFFWGRNGCKKQTPLLPIPLVCHPLRFSLLSSFPMQLASHTPAFCSTQSWLHFSAIPRKKKKEKKGDCQVKQLGYFLRNIFWEYSGKYSCLLSCQKVRWEDWWHSLRLLLAT